MTVLTIITTALQAIPSWLRQGLLLAFALFVVAYGALGILDVDTVLGLDRGKLGDVLLYLGGYLGVQSAVNVVPGQVVAVQDDGDTSEIDDELQS